MINYIVIKNGNNPHRAHIIIRWQLAFAGNSICLRIPLLATMHFIISSSRDVSNQHALATHTRIQRAYREIVFFCSLNCNNHCNHYNLIWWLVYTYWVITKHCGSWVWLCRFASGCLGRGCTRRPLGSLRIQTMTLCCYNLAVNSPFPK